MKINNISAYSSTFVASSENLCGTSNHVFSDWAIGTYFRINDGKPEARFEVMEKLYGKVLFRTDNYQELTNWIENHSEEIQKQIDTKKEEWIKNYKS